MKRVSPQKTWIKKALQRKREFRAWNEFSKAIFYMRCWCGMTEIADERGLREIPFSLRCIFSFLCLLLSADFYIVIFPSHRMASCNEKLAHFLRSFFIFCSGKITLFTKRSLRLCARIKNQVEIKRVQERNGREYLCIFSGRAGEKMKLQFLWGNRENAFDRRSSAAQRMRKFAVCKNWLFYWLLFFSFANIMLVERLAIIVLWSIGLHLLILIRDHFHGFVNNILVETGLEMAKTLNIIQMTIFYDWSIVSSSVLNWIWIFIRT